MKSQRSKSDATDAHLFSCPDCGATGVDVNARAHVCARCNGTGETGMTEADMAEVQS